MATITVSSREFNQDRARVKRSVEDGPVVITDRGKPTLVLLKFEEYEKLRQPWMSVAEGLAAPGTEHIELELPERPPYTPREINW